MASCFRVLLSRTCVTFAMFLLTAALSPLGAQTQYFLTGVPEDQVNKPIVTGGTATWSSEPPASAVPISQTGTVFANNDYVGNFLAAFWRGPYSGAVANNLEISFYFSTANPETIAIGGEIEVTVFADPDFSDTADPVQVDKIIGRAIIPLTGIGAAPTRITGYVPVTGVVTNEMVIQVVPQYIDSSHGLFIHYGATTVPSSFRFAEGPVRQPFPAAPIANTAPQRFTSYTPTAAQIAGGMGVSSGEPTLGVNWATGRAMYVSGLQTLRVTFDDANCSATWEDKSAPWTSQISFDPILYTDSETGRTMVSQLLFPTTDSAMAVTPDDGETWLPSQGAGIAAGIDHQTLGGGPSFADPIPGGATYENPVYYCGQDIAFANCGLSLDGGITFGPAIPIYTSSECGGLHGHIKVGPDGTAYVPNKGCGQNQAVVVSENNGVTWTVRKVPNSLAAGTDPSVAIDTAGRVYLGFADADRAAVVAVSEDKGANWIRTFDVGAALGIRNVVFPAMTAGDDGRAAMAFLGSTTPGAPDADTFRGVWHLYVASTLDGGETWSIVNATPNDPVQRGPVWLGGGGKFSRNLLDFIDAQIDGEGRVLVPIADGCVGGCVQAADSATGNSYTAHAVIVRQTGGPRLFGSTGGAATVPGAPKVTAGRNGNTTTLTWSLGDDGGAPVTSYRIYRGTSAGALSLFATTANADSWIDANTPGDSTYYYRVTAVNAIGESCGGEVVAARPNGSSCGDGIVIARDATGDQKGAPLNPALDVESVSIAEPLTTDASGELVFRMKVASLASLPANAQWINFFYFPNLDSGQYFVGMFTDENGGASFHWGHVATTDGVVTSVGQPVVRGAALPSSGYTTDGWITIAVTTSQFVPEDGGVAPTAGDILGMSLARTYIVTGSGATTSRAAIDLATGSDYLLTGNAYCAQQPPTVDCFEDDHESISYDGGGWHLVHDSAASGGHFRMNSSGKGTATMTLDVSGASGRVTLHYANSAKGGSADVFVDGVARGTIDFSASSGSAKSPLFGGALTIDGLTSGPHTVKIVGRGRGVIYLDGFCLETAASTGMATSGPGTTTSGTSTLLAGTELVKQVVAPANATAMSVTAETNGAPVRLILVDPLGKSIASAESLNGVASLDVPISLTGVYVLKTVNLSAGPLTVWSAVTPTIRY